MSKQTKKCDFCHTEYEENSNTKVVNSGTSNICEKCIESLHKIFNKSSYTNNRLIEKKSSEFDSTLTPKKVVSLLNEYVIGQDKAKKTIAVAVYNHYLRINSSLSFEEIGKSNILMIGPTGSGKTYIAQTIARKLNIPIVIADATTYSPTAFSGDDVKNIVLDLVRQTDGDIEKAQKGIIFLDEVDKLASSVESSNNKKGVGEAVQQCLLKMLEGTDISLNNGKSFNTNNVLFICSGAFVGLDEIVNKPKTKSLGFVSSQEDSNEEYKIKTEHLTQYGLVPEFIGRIPVIVKLEKLTLEQIKDIIHKPKNSIFNQFNNIIKIHGSELEFTDSLLNQIAEKAYNNNTGARGIRGIINDVLENILYELPDKENIAKIVVDDMFNEPTYISKS